MGVFHGPRTTRQRSRRRSIPPWCPTAKHFMTVFFVRICPVIYAGRRRMECRAKRRAFFATNRHRHNHLAQPVPNFKELILHAGKSAHTWDIENRSGAPHRRQHFPGRVDHGPAVVQKSRPPNPGLPPYRSAVAGALTCCWFSRHPFPRRGGRVLLGAHLAANTCRPPVRCSNAQDLGNPH